MAPATESVLGQVDPARIEKFQIEATYGKLFPLMIQDFRELKDCVGIHRPGNMMVTGNAGPFGLSGCYVTAYQVNYPMNEKYHPSADSKRAENKAKVEAGEAGVTAIEELV